jgi:hypothetical protein
MKLITFFSIYYGWTLSIKNANAKNIINEIAALMMMMMKTIKC